MTPTARMVPLLSSTWCRSSSRESDLFFLSFLMFSSQQLPKLFEDIAIEKLKGLCPAAQTVIIHLIAETLSRHTIRRRITVSPNDLLYKTPPKNVFHPTISISPIAQTNTSNSSASLQNRDYPNPHCANPSRPICAQEHAATIPTPTCPPTAPIHIHT